MSITMAHLLEVDIEKTLIFQGITLDIIGRMNHFGLYETECDYICIISGIVLCNKHTVFEITA